MPDRNDRYDRKTLLAAAAVFLGFAVFLYFVPDIMTAVGSRSPWFAGLIVLIVLVLPFAGLWLRGRRQRRKH